MKGTSPELVTALLILVAISSWRIARWEAALLVLGYGGYVVYQLRTLA